VLNTDHGSPGLGGALCSTPTFTMLLCAMGEEERSESGGNEEEKREGRGIDEDVFSGAGGGGGGASIFCLSPSNRWYLAQILLLGTFKTPDCVLFIQEEPEPLKVLRRNLKLRFKKKKSQTK